MYSRNKILLIDGCLDQIRRPKVLVHWRLLLLGGIRSLQTASYSGAIRVRMVCLGDGQLFGQLRTLHKYTHICTLG